MVFYILICSLIVILLGRVLYQQGSLWTFEFIEPLEKAKSINRLLLLLYYLLNLGLILMSVMIWEVQSGFWENLFYTIRRIGLVVTILGVLHCQNLFFILLIFHFKLIRLWKL